MTIKSPAKLGTPPGGVESVALNAVFVQETSRLKQGQEPISWILLTTHEVKDASDALRIVSWYRQRWIIEEMHRALKSQGMNIEESQIVQAKAMAKMLIIAMLASTRIIQLVRARDGTTGQKLTDGFEKKDKILLRKLCKTLEGKTEKQKNPHPEESLAWATWTIARLGGWHCYYKKPGPKTINIGLQAFDNIKRGWKLAQYNKNSVNPLAPTTRGRIRRRNPNNGSA